MRMSTWLWKRLWPLATVYSDDGSHATGLLLRARHLQTVPPPRFQTDTAETPLKRPKPWEAASGP